MFTILILCFSTLKLKCLIFNKFSFNSNLELSTINDKVCITTYAACVVTCWVCVDVVSVVAVV